MNKVMRSLWFLIAYIVCMPTLAYKQETHQFLSVAAARVSVLFGTSSILNDLALPAADALGNNYVRSNGLPGNALDMIGFGAINEDSEWLTRAFNHFYDPQYNNYTGRGLS